MVYRDAAQVNLNPFQRGQSPINSNNRLLGYNDGVLALKNKLQKMKEEKSSAVNALEAMKDENIKKLLD